MVAKEYAKLEGNYTYAGFDIDSTGRRLIDEIIHIAAYTPNDEFSQYIMPLMNLNPGARQRHNVRVITVGFFRMLKSMETYKVIKTKSEIATVMEFLNWLEKLNGDKDGVILIYHEHPHKLAPYMLVEVMKKYNLFERFDKIVKAFVNGYDLAPEEHKAKSKLLSLYENYKVNADKLGIDFNEKDGQEGNALIRAKYSYEIAKLLAQEGTKKDLDDKDMMRLMDDYIKPKTAPIDSELDELVEMEESLDRQTGMREIFVPYFSASRYHRRRALSFRRALADANQDKDKLQEIYNEGKRESIEKLIKDLESIKEEDREELINILDHHFDEEKKPIKPIITRQYNGDRNNMNNNNRMRRRPQQRRNNGGPRMQNNNKENRSVSRRNNRPPRNNSSKRRSGNGNINQDMHKMKDHQVNHQQNQMIAAN